MAISVGSCASSWTMGGLQGNRRGGKVICGASYGRLTDHYRTLQVRPGASEKEVKKAFRQLALQYHPDVCKGSNCGVQFHQINQAYDIVISQLRASEEEAEPMQTRGMQTQGSGSDEEPSTRGMYDSDFYDSDGNAWEDWMGWEGASFGGYRSSY